MTRSALPLLIFGQITESSIGVDTITVKCRNETTNDVGTTTTNDIGLYIFDLSDSNLFPNGWTDGDQITIYTIYKSFEGQTTFTIELPNYGYETNIALSAVVDSELIDYCVVQDVYDELDAKTSSDISASRIVKAVQRAEGLIDTKTGTSFKAITITDETHTADRYSLDTSPDNLDTIYALGSLRGDSMSGASLNRVKTYFAPIVSISSLSINSAGVSAADSWTALTEQSGSSGDFIIEDADAGIIDFLTNYPRIGKRSWKLTYVYGYSRSSTDRRVTSILKVAERLTILLASKQIITTKSTGAIFDTTRDIKIGAIELKGGAQSSSQYLTSIEPELMELWRELGELGIEVI